MSKNIVLCSDGTANKGGVGQETNVWRIYNAIDLHDHLQSAALDRQIAFHDDGVGTQSLKFLKAIGGAFGWGLQRNVRQFYTQLVRVYDPGDRIYLFGFSRGAYTVRMLAGLICKCGIIDRNDLSEAEIGRSVGKAHYAYRHSYRTLLGRLLRRVIGGAKDPVAAFKAQHAVHDPVEIEFIGVWDTVAAVGLPFEEMAHGLNKIFPFRFPNYKLNRLVRRGCHAISIDDQRQTFYPVLWDESMETTDRIEQVWFAGVHSNVGGGYPKQGMSYVALDWMMVRAGDSGLRFLQPNRDDAHDAANENDKLYDSRSALAVYYRYLPRDISGLCREFGMNPAKLHTSVLGRIDLGTEGYAPGNIPETFELVATDLTTPPSGQGLTSLSALAGRLKGLIAAERRTFDRGNAWVWFRVSVYYAFVFLSIALVVQVFRYMPCEVETWYGCLGENILDLLALNWGQILDGLKELAKQNPGLLKFLVSGLVTVFVLSMVCRDKIHSRFCAAWDNIKPLNLPW